MNAPSTVLILDHSVESRHVLRTLLERQGARAIEAGEASEALRIAEVDPPDLIVIDQDTTPSNCFSGYRELHEAAGRKNTPILVIGSLKKHKDRLPHHRFITKPYHYRDLLRKIEELLSNVA